MKRSVLAAMIVAAALWAGDGAAGPAASADAQFVVNTAGDADDGACDGAHCSLREAIRAANDVAGADTIRFSIPVSDAGYVAASDSFRIAPGSPLPPVTDAVTIDGYSQPDASANFSSLAAGLNAVIKIEINGGAVATSTPGLIVVGGGSTVKGLSITGFPQEGIRLETNGGNRIEGNFLGMDATGLVASPNEHGISVLESSGNLIGGTDPAQANLISGNSDSGVILVGGASSGNTIAGNLIGTSRSGSSAAGNAINGVGVFEAPGNAIGGGNVISGNRTGVNVVGAGSSGNAISGNLIGLNSAGAAAVPNQWSGVMIAAGASDNVVGGSGAGNVISGNLSEGVALFDAGTSGNRILGNLIGAAANGTTPLGNGLQGVAIWSGASGNLVGGAGAGEGNLIANNQAGGIRIESGTGNRLARNELYSNVDAGIDLGFDDVTDNDVDDSDGGANGLQNYPAVVSAVPRGAGTAVRGSLNSAANGAYTLEFFFNTQCDPTTHGEGERYVESLGLATNGLGAAPFDFVLGTRASVGEFVTVTATDAGGNTSEFSECTVVRQPPNTTFAGRVAAEAMSVDDLVALASPTVTADRDGGAPVAGQVLTDGTFWASDLPEDAYSMTVDATGYLPARRTGLAANGGMTVLPEVTLLAGDSDDSGAIDMGDVDAVLASFTQSPSNRTDGGGRVVDFNLDRVVDIHDLTIVAANFGAAGPLAWQGSTRVGDDRFALVLHTETPEDQDRLLGRLGAAWFLDGGFSTARPSTAEKLMWIGSLGGIIGGEPGPAPADLAKLANENRGATWLLANEPNRRAGYEADAVLDDLHDAYEAIKAADPTAIIVSPPTLNFLFTCAGCAPFDTGISWAEDFYVRYLLAYGEAPPIDIWAVNAYPLDLTNLPALSSGAVKNQVSGLRSWLDSRAPLADKPIWVTEFGAQWGYSQRSFPANCNGFPAPGGAYDEDGVVAFLDELYTWFDENAASLNVRRWFQYIAHQDITTCNEDSYAGAIMFNGPSAGAALTRAGELFRKYAADLD